MSHQSVEIHWRGQPDVAGIIGDFRHARKIPLEVADCRVGPFEGRPLVEVEHQQ